MLGKAYSTGGPGPPSALMTSSSGSKECCFSAVFNLYFLNIMLLRVNVMKLKSKIVIVLELEFVVICS